MARINRRRFLAGISVASFAGIAGCSMLGSDTEDNTTSPTDNGTEDGQSETFEKIYSSTLRHIESGVEYEFISIDHVESVKGREKIGEDVHLQVQLTQKGKDFVSKQYSAANASENYDSLEVGYFFKGEKQETKLLLTSPHTHPDNTTDSWDGKEVLIVSTTEQADEIEANI